MEAEGLRLQTDGYLVIYNSAGAGVWNIGQHTIWGGPWLEVGNDGKIYFWGANKGSRQNLIWTN